MFTKTHKCVIILADNTKVCYRYLLPVTVVYNGKKGLSMEEKKIYTVYPGLVCDKLSPECILDRLSIGDVVQKILHDFGVEGCDLPFTLSFVNLDFCGFNYFVYHLYFSLSHFVIISFGIFYQLILDTVQVTDVKDGD